MNNNYNNNLNPEKHEKIEDILKSIRGIIDGRNNTHLNNDMIDNQDINDEDNVIELTSEINSKNISSYLISEEVKKTVQEEIARLELANSLVSEDDVKPKSIDKMTRNLITPLIKHWLDSNLPSIVEKIVSQEIKKIIRNK